jgi:nucleoside-diphosphate-sugar epimerase
MSQTSAVLDTDHGNKARRILITGAEGRLGRSVRRELAGGPHTFISIDCRGNAQTNVLEIDLLNGADVRQAMIGCDAVIHLGNHAGAEARAPAQLFNENVAMTMNVFQAARALGIRRILYASSIQVIASEWIGGDSARGPRLAYLPLDGDSPADPTNSYAQSKRVGEMILEQWASEIALEAASIRYPLLLRTADDPDGRRKNHRHREPKAPSPTLIAQGFTWLSFRDAVRLLVALLHADPWQGVRTYLPAASTARHPGTIGEIVEQFYTSIPRKSGSTEPLGSLVDNSAITREIGWTPLDTTFDTELG